MAWCRKNNTLKIRDVQKITLEHTRKGITQEWIYHNIIYPKYFISKSTYNNYLATNINKDIKEFSSDERFQRTLFDIENF